MILYIVVLNYSWPVGSTLKIALVITELDPGGAERNLTRIALGLREAGHQVSVVSLAPAPSNLTLVGRLIDADVETLFLNCKTKWAVGKAFLRLRKVLRDRQPEIVQSFLYHANLLCSLILKRSNVKHFIGLRVSDPRPGRYRRLARHQNSWAGVICVSEDVRKHAMGFFPHARNLIVIPNGVEIEEIKKHSNAKWPSDLESASEKLVFVGRLDYQKGVDSIIEHGPIWLTETDRSIYFVGDGPLRREMETLSRQKAISKRIHFLGYRDDALAIIANADLFLFPSRWEGMPNAVLEAMALARVVCATPADGVNELLSHDQRQIASRQDWGSAVQALLSLSKEDMREIGQANQQKINQSYTARQMISRYLDAFNVT